MNKFLVAVRRKITAVRRELLAHGLKGTKALQPFSGIGVLITKPASKGSQKIKNYKYKINNYLKY
jgi:hypothetical protein